MKSKTLRKAVGATAIVAVLGIGGAAVSARSETGASYRTATAGTHEVDQVLDAVGTVEPVSQAAVAFPTSGTVASVSVAVGDSVAVGQTLATLDTEDLQVSLHEAQAALDQAELLLARALDGEDVSSSAASGPGGAVGRSAGAAANGALAAAQQAVLDAQTAVDEAMAAAEAALASAVEVCGASAVTDPTDPDDGTTTTTTVATGAASSADESSEACSAALAASLEAQQALAAAQADLAEASAELTALLEDLADTAEDATTTTTTTTPSSSSGGAPSGAGGSGTSSASTSSGAPSGSTSTTDTSSSPTAEELIAYQKDVDAAALDVAVAEQALAQAEIVSPIDGTVVAVGFEVGDDVEAASATQTIVVVGDGGFEVTTKVSVSDLPDLEVGQPAIVRPDGSDVEIEGEVVRIGVAPDASSTSTYTVTIGLTGDTSTLGNGATASIEIVTKATEEALAVPTSAVTVDGDRSTVRVLADGADEPEDVEVEVGAIGRAWTEVTSGVEDGDVVVLAELDEPLPGSATDGASSSSGTTDQGGFPGGGAFTGGEPPSGGPPGGMGAPTGN